jgi:Na(+)-translocating NADH:ubiquinone oxidoreductase A subunit
MKIRGGYLPRIAGRPVSRVKELPLPEKLYLGLQRGGLNYTPVIKDGQKIGMGESLAEASIDGGVLALPSPASGRVFLHEKEQEELSLILKPAKPETASGTFKKFQPQRVTGQAVREALAKGGIWPFFWSSLTGDVPSLDEYEKPRAIIVNSVLTEPFRARGKVILQRSWEHIVQGLKFLQRLQADYGTTHITLTDKRDPVARMLYSDLAGFAWLRFHPVPLLYPVENPRILNKALRRRDSSIKKDDIIWVIDIQGVEAVGACLADGMPLHQRIVVVGGPGISTPEHISVRIGTPIRLLTEESIDPGKNCVLRGGLLNGEPISSEEDAVFYDDDGFFFLPVAQKREFLSFLRPGLKRTSILPCFASRVTGAADSQISTSLRGERRPCIACGLCEKICPSGLMPQVLHRYLYREAIDEAEAVGLDLCVKCGLCTYVCPSKIELQKQFNDASEQLRLEHEEARAALLEKNNEDL